jgi:predicted RNase H-related nuclease YkuK (DUF458 family)
MKNILAGYFYSPSKGNLTLDQLTEEITDYMSEKLERSYEIIVGCDSSSEKEPLFPIAVVVLRKGEGGRFFLKKINYRGSGKKFYNWKERILEEVLLSCQLALSLREKIIEKVKNRIGFCNYQFRYIHADVGENGRTKDMIKEVVGLIRGNGFEAKIKPESYVASVVADRFT